MSVQHRRAMTGRQDVRASGFIKNKGHYTRKSDFYQQNVALAYKLICSG